MAGVKTWPRPELVSPRPELVNRSRPGVGKAVAVSAPKLRVGKVPVGAAPAAEVPASTASVAAASTPPTRPAHPRGRPPPGCGGVAGLEVVGVICTLPDRPGHARPTRGRPPAEHAAAVAGRPRPRRLPATRPGRPPPTVGAGHRNGQTHPLGRSPPPTPLTTHPHE